MINLIPKIKRLAHIVEVAMTYKYSDLKRTREYYIRHYDNAQIDSHVVLYESRDGQSMTDSPLAIFRYLKANKQYQDLQHVWVVTDTSKKHIEKMVANLPKDYGKDIIWIKRNSIDYAKWLLRAKYLITNSTFQSFWHKKTEQIYINTWHGTPLKFMGYDIPGSKTSLKNVQRNLFMADYIISPNEHTSHVFLDRYKLNGLYQGKVLEAGYPRIDLTYGNNHEATLNYLKQQGIQIDQKKPIVMYTPTWKGTSITNPSGSINQIYEEIKVLKQLNPDKNILVKVHPYAYKLASRHEELKAYLVPDEVDANLILGITDILITDYSSIFFDFMVTDKPIIFYAWDHELYSSYRGMYFKDSELPGPIFDDIQQVGQALQQIDQVIVNYKVKYQSLKEKIVPYDDGQVTKRIVQTIFDQKTINGIKYRRATGLNKTKILIYPGGMGNNGITTSAINLSHNLDYDKYDVTYLLWDNNNDEIVRNVSKLDDHIRIMYRFGVTALTRPENKRDRYISEHGINNWSDDNIPKTGYLRESDRLFNSVQFDTLIDFSGYSYNGSKLFAVMPRKNLVVYQHNDLYADSQKVINGKKVHAKKLNALFTLYPVFDKIVSVSETLRQINQKKLVKYVRPEQMVAVPNSLTIPVNNSEVNESINIPTIEDYQAPATLRKTVVNVFCSLVDIQTGTYKQINIMPTNDIRVVGRATLQNKIYFKLAIDDLPNGWVQAKDISIQETNELIYQSECYQIGWIYNNKRRLFKTPYLKGEDTGDVIGQAKWLNHTFVKIVSYAETGDGVYYQIKLPKSNQLGWLKASSILLMQQSDRFAFYQWLWNRISNKVTEEKYNTGVIQLFTLIRDTDLTNQPLGLSKRGIRHRQLVESDKLYVATASAQTKKGCYLQVKIGQKNWWINEHDIQLQSIDIPITDEQVFSITNFINQPIKKALVFSKNIKKQIILQFDKIPDDLEIIAGYSVPKYKDNKQVVELYSKLFDEQLILPVSELFVVDTSYFDLHYNFEKTTNIVVHKALMDGSQDTVAVDNIVEIARVWNWQRQSFMIYVRFLNQYGWISDDVITKFSVKKTVLVEERGVDEQSQINLQVDMLPVDQPSSVLKIDQPWIIRKIDVFSMGHHFSKLVRQNGQTILMADDGESKPINEISEPISGKLLYANDRNWGNYDSFVFVAVGRLSPEKNQTMLLDAFAKVYQTHPEVELIILGEGVIRQDLEEQAIDLGVSDAVLFTGQVDNPNDYLAMADVFVHPSLYEGQPMVLLEAMMQHKLIVATNIAANVGVLGNQKYGLLTQNISTMAFTDMMLFAIEKQTRLEKFNIEDYQQRARQAFGNLLK